MLVVLSVVIACTLSADLAAAERTNKGRPDGAVDAGVRVRAQDGIGRSCMQCAFLAQICRLQATMDRCFHL